jgi:hypothetical protein
MLNHSCCEKSSNSSTWYYKSSAAILALIPLVTNRFLPRTACWQRRRRRIMNSKNEHKPGTVAYNNRQGLMCLCVCVLCVRCMLCGSCSPCSLVSWHLALGIRKCVLELSCLAIRVLKRVQKRVMKLCYSCHETLLFVSCCLRVVAHAAANMWKHYQWWVRWCAQVGSIPTTLTSSVGVGMERHSQNGMDGATQPQRNNH